MERDRDEWRRPWTAPDDGRVVVADEAAFGPDAARARAMPRPLPPPSTWDASHEGPGSPAGSVRPPDTVGTVEPPATRPRRGGVVFALLGALVGGIIGTAGTLAFVGDGDDTRGPDAGPRVNAPTIDVSGEFEEIVPAVAAAVTPSVVRINNIAQRPTGAEVEQGLGSGVVYRSDGYILTNNHVVEGAGRLEVKLSSGEVHRAELVGTDPLNDLAVLKIDVDGLPEINLRLDEEPVVGETAIAIGSPFGLDASVTAGVVSAVGRDITVPQPEGPQLIPAVIQTDAAINPGNSGGALVDREGRLMGINTAILSATGGSQGVGFAIPVQQAVTSADQIIETGVVRHAFLGVRGRPVTAEMAERFGLGDDRGALVESVDPGTGAAEAGLQADDIIVAVEGEEIRSMVDLAVAIRQYRPGDTVTITYLRDGQRREAEVTLGERPDGS